MEGIPPEQAKVLQALEAAHNPDPKIRVPAQGALDQNKSQWGFNLCLLALAERKSMTHDHRLLAVIQLKNNCKDIFVRRAGDEDSRDRELLKQGLLQQFDEPNDQVSSYFALSIAQTARHEWPRNWDALFPTILSSIENRNVTVSRHALYTLKEVLRHMASRRAVLSRGAFEQAAAKILNFITPKWIQMVPTFLQQYSALLGGQQQPSSNLVLLTELTLLYSKCLHFVIVHGVDNPGQDQHCRDFFGHVNNVQQKLLSLLIQNHAKVPPVFRKNGISILQSITRTVIGTQEKRPLDFRHFIGTYVQRFCISLQQLPSPLDPELTPFSVQSIKFLSNVVGCRQYDPERVNAGIRVSVVAGVRADQSALKEAQQSVQQLLQPRIIADIAQMILSKYLPLSDADIDLWLGDPEEYADCEQNVGYDETRRSAAENLIGNLAKRFPSTMTKILLEGLSQNLKRCPPGTLPDPQGTNFSHILSKAASYKALGICAHELKDILKAQGNFDFSHFFMSVLSKELTIPAGEVPEDRPVLAPCIVRTQAIWAVGQWAEFITPAVYENVYSVIGHLFSDKDMVLLLTTVQTLQYLVESPHPEKTKVLLERKLEPVLETVFSIISKSERLSSQQRGLTLIESIIGTMEENIVRGVPTIIKFLPRAWVAAERYNILRSRILVTLSQLVYSLRARSAGLHSMLLPLLRQCCTPSQNPGQGDLFYLLDPALELWCMVMQQTPTLSPELLKLFEVWVHLMQSGNMDCFDLRMQLLESYMVISHPSASAGPQGSSDPQADPFMNQYAKPVAEILNKRMYNDMSDGGLIMVLRCLETMAQLHTGPFVRMFGAQVLAKGIVVLIQEQLLDQAALRKAEEDSSAGLSLSDRVHARLNRPSRLDVPSEILISYCSALSRVVLHSDNDFKQVVVMATQQLASAHPFNPEQLQQKSFFQIGDPEFPSYVSFLIRQHVSSPNSNAPPALSPPLVLGLLIDAWSHRIDNMAQPYRRKLNALALCNLVPSNDPQIVQQVPTIVNVVSGVVMELEEDSIGYPPSHREAQAKNPNERTEEDRLILVNGGVPENHVQLRAHAYAKLGLLSQFIGKDRFNNLTSQIHPSCLAAVTQAPK